jgi:hypothetical protein
MKKILLIFFIAAVFCTTYPQSSINPDISLIGTFNTFTNFIKGSPEYGKINFETPEMELFVDGYLNPFARATANIAYEEGEFAVEELYANIVRGLPLDLQLKAGKYLVGFGKINTIHPHAWLFLERPLFHQVFFSPDGFNEVGASLSYLLPTGDLYSDLEIGIYNGQSIPMLIDTNAVERGINPILIGRLNSFFNTGDYTNLEVGLSSSYGYYSKAMLNSAGDINAAMQEKSLNYLYTGIDFKYKYSPDSYSALTIQGEALLDYRDAVRQESFGINRDIDEVKKISNFGGFIYADYKFEKQFGIGVKYDYTAGIIDDEPSLTTLINDDKNNTQGIEGWISYYPVEETTALRLGVQHLMFKYDDGTNRDGETTIKIQLLFSLGPHKAHPF